ncbi:MAG: hypothetical protein JWP34_277 [Massilia sp.]|nr:hypothetical protein [Massilia sp.]
MKQNKLVTALVAVAACATLSFSAQAAVIDWQLTTLGQTQTISGATYTQVSTQATGTGVIPSFVQVGGNQNVVEAYNTTVDNVFQNGSSDVHNHAVSVGSIGFIDLNGAATPGGLVMRFLLDINQNNGGTNNFLSLDEVQIFLSTSPDQGFNTSPAQGAVLGLANSSLIYQLDKLADNRIKLDAQIGGGSGTGDVILDIPFELFAPGFASLGLNSASLQNGAFIYLYSKFGSQFTNNDGFEEWGALQGAAVVDVPCVPGTLGCGPQEQVPEPHNLALLAIGLLGIGAVSRKRRNW